MSCRLCPGVCEGVDLLPLLTPELAWLWEAVAKAADRRGDEALTTGIVNAVAPADPAARSAAAGLVRSRAPRAGQSVRVHLAALTAELSTRSPALTPGAVAAHAVGWRLAVKARQREARDAATATILEDLRTGLADLPTYLGIDPDSVVERLSRSGWVARVRNTDNSDVLLAASLSVLARLPEPGVRVDRRTLVHGDPHALDSGVLPSLVLAVMGVAGQRVREAWAELGVDIDDLVGGLIVTGVQPDGWVVPAGSTMTLPPQELAGIRWAAPAVSGEWVFVTENPSVLSAAVQTFRKRPVGAAMVPRVVCTVGTPSQVECAAVGALADAGWQVAVRADFDVAGLAHVRALLTAAPLARPWRMGAGDYLAVARKGDPVLKISNDASPWDAELAEAMNELGVPAFEEDLLPVLLDDVLRRSPL
jgi:uncharacterized protein (TIGR02679 family)